MRKCIWSFLTGLFLIGVTGCGGENSPQVEYLEYLCELKTKKCGEPEIWRFKVRKHENRVLVNVYDSKGNPEDNEFLKNCEILNKENWRCINLSMIDGELIDNGKDYSLGSYWRYEKRMR